MLQSTVVTITLTNGGNYTFPTGFKSIDQLVYSSADGNVFNPTFKDDGVYTLVGNTITYDAQYTGTVDQYFTYDDTLIITSNPVTVDDLIQRAKRATQVELVKNPDGSYDADSMDTVNTFIDGFNEGLQEIADIIRPTYIQAVTLDANKQFDISTLDYLLSQVISLKDSNGNLVTYKNASDWQYVCPYQEQGDVLTLTYSYQPATLTAITDRVDNIFPPGMVKIDWLAHRGAIEYGLIDNSDFGLGIVQSQTALWNKAISSIKPKKQTPGRIRCI